MAWKLYRISSGHYTIDNFELGAEEIPAVLRTLQACFQERLTLGRQAGIGLSQVGIEVLVDGSPLTVGWDNWSGVFLMAEDAAGDAILTELDDYLHHV
ncbi:MAG: hypothetical protein HFF50_10190 [Lawsonibacter sp.]|nr:hypothetical protein [Lawsonibacter sp.]